jgi:hypothetical protein
MRIILTQTRTATTRASLRLALRLQDGWTRLQDRTQPRDGGYSTETIIVTALLVLMAIAVCALLSQKLTAKVDGLNF